MVMVDICFKVRKYGILVNLKSGEITILTPGLPKMDDSLLQ
jgi:hypothetical protein